MTNGANHCFIFYRQHKALYTVWSISVWQYQFPITIKLRQSRKKSWRDWEAEVQRSCKTSHLCSIRQWWTWVRKSNSGAGNVPSTACIHLGFWHHLRDTAQHISQQKHHQRLHHLWTSQPSTGLMCERDAGPFTYPQHSQHPNTLPKVYHNMGPLFPSHISPLPSPLCSSGHPKTLLCLLRSLTRPTEGVAPPNKLGLNSVVNWPLDITFKDFGISDVWFKTKTTRQKL